jgi:hypothetical protein
VTSSGVFGTILVRPLVEGGRWLTRFSISLVSE